MKKVKKVYKFATGDSIPEGAVYLSTVTQEIVMPIGFIGVTGNPIPQLVWHYFLVEIEEEQ